MADDARDVLADVIQRASAEYRRLSRAIQVGDLPPAALPDVGQLAEERFIADAIIAHWSAAGWAVVPREASSTQALGEAAREAGRTYAFIQWKGTDVCLDFNCECGCDCHIDADFVYAIKCPSCGAIWEMPHLLTPTRNDAYDGGSLHEPVADED